MIWELAVVQNADGRLVGACELTCENAREGDLGFIFSKDAWWRGDATEAAQAMVRAGFDELGLSRTVSTCDGENAESARMLKKAGLSAGRGRRISTRTDGRATLMSAPA